MNPNSVNIVLPAETLFDDGAGEFTGDRLSAFPDDCVDCLGERETRLETTGNDRQSLSQLSIELLDPPGCLERQVEPGKHRSGDEADSNHSAFSHTDPDAVVVAGERGYRISRHHPILENVLPQFSSAGRW